MPRPRRSGEGRALGMVDGEQDMVTVSQDGLRQLDVLIKGRLLLEIILKLPGRVSRASGLMILPSPPLFALVLGPSKVYLHHCMCGKSGSALGPEGISQRLQKEEKLIKKKNLRAEGPTWRPGIALDFARNCVGTGNFTTTGSLVAGSGVS
ncbi:uncharacterized protein BO80DRAFT_426755 [Aspergillus ibericus CBS 121593]|uniref:Uncharacterized protein n=1 Tax=Aspergillus ibericus CBS 121593 TaxID=1448316 RepID=A0A395GUS1_9EURO|nr:hypothetical protein BO80DRAFT_426755 [Aspergillus ibericus CBS 121593]RAK99216.1 hypothetical protein BO80DRAFT_426755 [Aspergillus ibericus CBS 121593]